MEGLCSAWVLYEISFRQIGIERSFYQNNLNISDNLLGLVRCLRFNTRNLTSVNLIVLHKKWRKYLTSSIFQYI